MNCNTCGAELEEGAKFCPKCGNPVGDNVAAPVFTPVQAQTVGLGWANFLSHFALWAGAVINTYNAIVFLTGLVYASSGLSSATVYDIYGRVGYTVDQYQKYDIKSTSYPSQHRQRYLNDQCECKG